MLVMPSNNSKLHVGYLAGKFPGRLGHLYSPGGFRGPYPFLPYALDNGRYACWEKGVEWSEANWVSMLERARDAAQEPLWAICPDVVTDREGTLAEWSKWNGYLRSFGWPLAFAVQDGMTPADVPRDAAVVFVGGTVEWKMRMLGMWCSKFPRVHVGKVNGWKRLWQCHEAGAESCDGTGWYRGDDRQLRGLVRYLERSTAGQGDGQKRLLA